MALVLDLLPSVHLSVPPIRILGYFFVEPGIQSTFTTGLVMFVGAYVARVNFVGVAIALSVISIVGATYVLQAVASPVEHTPFLEIVAFNAVNSVLGLTGAVVGADLGRRYYQSRKRTAVDRE